MPEKNGKEIIYVVIGFAIGLLTMLAVYKTKKQDGKFMAPTQSL